MATCFAGVESDGGGGRCDRDRLTEGEGVEGESRISKGFDCANDVIAIEMRRKDEEKRRQRLLKEWR